MQERAWLQPQAPIGKLKRTETEPADREDNMTEEETRRFTDLFEVHYSRIYNYIAYRVDSRHTAEDLASTVFERSWRHFRAFRPDKAPLEVWLIAIARNAVNDYYRERRRSRWFSLDVLKEKAEERKGPETIAIDVEEQDRLTLAVQALNAKERHIVALKFGAGLRNTEIARLTEMTESNVGVVLYRTMKKLKRTLEKLEHQ